MIHKNDWMGIKYVSTRIHVPTSDGRRHSVFSNTHRVPILAKSRWKHEHLKGHEGESSVGGNNVLDTFL